jgi:hypothetical protein
MNLDLHRSRDTSAAKDVMSNVSWCPPGCCSTWTLCWLVFIWRRVQMIEVSRCYTSKVFPSVVEGELEQLLVSQLVISLISPLAILPEKHIQSHCRIK